MSEQAKSRDEGNWAKPISELHVSHELPSDAVNRNVEGRRVGGLGGGFGKMWQKTYRIALEGSSVSPEQAITAWKEHFPEFWPKGARFFGPMASVTPGDVALLNMKMPGGVKLSTGILVLYADDVSFSFITPEGHMFNSMITFSASTVDGHTVAQVQAMLRASDPLYEVAMAMGGHRKEDKHWKHTLESLARYFGVNAKAEMDKQLVDKHRQWKYFGNIKRSAALRSAAYSMGAPFRAVAKPFRRDHAA
jgi:hypothetical protein